MQSHTVAPTTNLTSTILTLDNASNGVQQLNNQVSNIPLNQLEIFKSITNVSNKKRSVKEAKDLGRQVEYNLRLNGYNKHEAKVIGGLVKFLKEKTSGAQEEPSVNTSQTQDNTDALKGKKHSRIGFYFKKFINLFNKKESPNKTSINAGLQSLKDILNQSQEGKDLLEQFQRTLKSEKKQMAFITQFSNNMNVQTTQYPESIPIGDQTLQLKNVPGDGNCGIWSLLQLMHPEKNYLACFNANSSQEKEAMLAERQNVANFAKENGASENEITRISKGNEYLETTDFKYLAQYYQKDIVICANLDTYIQYETYYANGQFDFTSGQQSYNSNAHYIYFQNEHFQALLPPQNEG